MKKIVLATLLISVNFCANAQFSEMLKDLKTLSDNLKQHQPVLQPTQDQQQEAVVIQKTSILLAVESNINQGEAIKPVLSIIPDQFHGFWATQVGCHQINNEGIDAPSIEVKKFEINFPFNSCKLNSVKKSDSLSFSGQFTCQGEEGDISKKSIEISLSSGAKLSTKNEINLINLSICKIKK